MDIHKYLKDGKRDEFLEICGGVDGSEGRN
jgi:hypothetical protein